MALVRRVVLASMVATATTAFGCTSLLGDFTVTDTGSDASSSDGSSGDGQVTADGGGDGMTIGDGPAADSGTAHLVIDKMMKDFGTHTLSSAVTAETFTITNNGTGTTGALTITVNGSAYRQSGGSCVGTPATTLAKGASCTVDISIDTSRIGMPSGTLVVADGASDMVSASLSGNIVMSCPGNMPTLCSGTCVDTVADPLNCSTCGNRCPTVPNGSGGCASSMCGIGMCNVGFKDCNNMASDGCEVGITNDVANCGGCLRQCTIPNGQPSCVNSTCTVQSCSNGFSDCNMTASDGCEANLNSDVLHCGSCAGACNLPNAVPGCVGGTCKIQSCNGTFHDCDNVASNGCEADWNSSDANCGGCGNACMGGKHCAGGTCACVGGAPDLCGGVCTSKLTDAANCGACGHGCLGGTCSGGACQPVTLGSISGNGAGIAAEQGSVFFAAGGTSAYKCDAMSGCGGTPFAVATGFTTAVTVFADVPSGFVFVTDQNAGVTSKINPNGGARLFNITAQSNPVGLAADNNFVYWGSTDRIGRANKYDGSGATTIASGLSFVYGLSFDPNTGALFAVDYSATGKVVRCNSPGAAGCGASWATLAANQPNPTAVTVAGGNMYFTRLGTSPTYSDGGLLSVPVGGGSTTANAVGASYGFAFGATSDASYVYFSGGGAIHRVAYGTFGSTVIAAGVGVARAVTNDNVAVYWINDSGTVMKVAK